MNDDFMMNALYSGAFTDGVAMSETLFQHDVFVLFLVLLNNTITKEINWYYYIHFLCIWIPIFFYLFKFHNATKLSDFLKLEFLILIFIGIWVTRLFTFTWIASLAGMISWLWFWRCINKNGVDWIAIVFISLISMLVRPPSFLLISFVAVIIQVIENLNPFIYKICKTNILSFIYKAGLPLIIILLFNQIFVATHINPANSKKFPLAWVTEEIGLKSEILSKTGALYDEVDYNLSRKFYFDDRFQGKISFISGSSIIKETFSLNYFGMMLKIFATNATKIIFDGMMFLFLIAIFFLHFGFSKDFKLALLLFLLILLFLLVPFVFLNMPVLKSRVIVPTFVFVLLYFWSVSYKKREEIKLDIISTKSLVLSALVLGLTITNLVYFAFKAHRIEKSTEILVNRVNYQNKFDKNLLFIDGDLWLWWPITGVSRIKVNQLRIPLMPGGWGMRSNTFQNLLKERGFSNLESGYKSGNLVFVNDKPILDDAWNLYFKKYFSDYKIKTSQITIVGEKAYAFTLIND